MRLPAYGGALFDPDRFPFLEGRLSGTNWREVPAQPLPVSNRTVLHLLEALQFLQMRIPGGGVEPRGPHNLRLELSRGSYTTIAKHVTRLALRHIDLRPPQRKVRRTTRRSPPTAGQERG